MVFKFGEHLVSEGPEVNDSMIAELRHPRIEF
jgi:hypothetical protein